MGKSKKSSKTTEDHPPTKSPRVSSIPKNSSDAIPLMAATPLAVIYPPDTVPSTASTRRRPSPTLRQVSAVTTSQVPPLTTGPTETRARQSVCPPPESSSTSPPHAPVTKAPVTETPFAPSSVPSVTSSIPLLSVKLEKSSSVAAKIARKYKKFRGKQGSSKIKERLFEESRCIEKSGGDPSLEVHNEPVHAVDLVQKEGVQQKLVHRIDTVQGENVLVLTPVVQGERVPDNPVQDDLVQVEPVQNADVVQGESVVCVPVQGEVVVQGESVVQPQVASVDSATVKGSVQDPQSVIPGECVVEGELVRDDHPVDTAQPVHCEADDHSSTESSSTESIPVPAKSTEAAAVTVGSVPLPPAVQKDSFHQPATESIVDVQITGSKAGTGTSKKRTRAQTKLTEAAFSTPSPSVSKKKKLFDSPGATASKHRRAESSSDSESSVATAPFVDKNGVMFVNQDMARCWSLVNGKQFIYEHEIDLESDNVSSGVKNCIVKGNLQKTVTGLVQPIPQLVKEFYANILEDIDKDDSPHFQEVFVRGKWFKFSPSVISDYLELVPESESGVLTDLDVIAVELSGRKLSSWPPRPRDVSTADLTDFYKMLRKIAAKNWTPTLQRTAVWKTMGLALYKVGCGEYAGMDDIMYMKVIHNAIIAPSKSAIVFPSLITGILQSQGVTLGPLDQVQPVPKFSVSELGAMSTPVKSASKPPRVQPASKASVSPSPATIRVAKTRASSSKAVPSPTDSATLPEQRELSDQGSSAVLRAYLLQELRYHQTRARELEVLLKDL